MNEKKYDKAIRNFSAIREDFPFDPVAPYALVKMADCYFFKKEYMTASKLYEEFLSTYPNDENIPHVLFRAGECYEKLSLSPERDQEFTNKAIEKYSAIISRFGDSPYSKDAKTKKKSLEDKLAQRELLVGEFYFRTYEYNACILRLEYLLDRYPDAKGVDKALFYLSRAYEELGNFEKSNYYAERLKNQYPGSPYAQKIGSKKEKGTTNRPDVSGLKKERVLPPVIEEIPPATSDTLSFFDAKKGVDIVASKMEGFEKENRILFEGSVILKQEDLTMVSEKLEAYLSEDRKEIRKMFAKGNVKIVKGERTATCKEAEFDNELRIIILRGDVDVVSGPDRLKGETVIYFLDEEKVVVSGEKGSKAKVIIFPK